MRNALNLIEKNRSIKKKMIFAFLFLSILVVTLTISFLIRPAYSAVNKADCGVVEHTHTAQCYSEHKNYGDSVLVCCSDLSQEMLSHIHDDFCYDENGKIICPLSEYQHVHTDDCYDENGVQICGTAYHQHGKECFRVLDENESALVLECGKEAHVHVDSCYPELSSAPLEKMQVDFEKTQIIEPDFEEAEIIESKMELYESVIDNGISLLNDENSNVASSDGYVLTTSNIESVTLQYKDAKGKWITVTNGTTNVPANADMRIDVNYKNVSISNIVNNTIIYNGIPKWLNPDSTGNIYDEYGNVVASLSVGDEKAVITFVSNYLNGKTEIEGSFSVEGSADWRQIDDPSNPAELPGFKFNFTFEDNLAAKYGNFKVDKKHAEKPVEVWDENGKLTHTYLKYELKVKSEESEIVIPNICITDVLSTENWLNLSDVIVGNGYIGVTATETILESSENAYNPYETISNVQNTHGKVVLVNQNNSENSPKNLKWEIENLKPNEERTLVYYVELNEKYVGSGSAGILRNEAKPESKGFKKESVRDEFIPKADVDIHKESVKIDVNDFGNGTIDYTITVSANPNNSYTITDAYIKDTFRGGMSWNVNASQPMEVTIKKISKNTSDNIESSPSVNIGADGFTVDVPNLHPGETVEITYSLPVQHLFSSNNGDVSLSNHASFVGGNKYGKLKKNHTFKGSGVTTTVSHNQWMRKMNGQTVDADRTIEFGSNDAVYNYGNNTAQSGINGFTVPQNAQEYTVIVNEDGTWDMSGTGFHDNFRDRENRVLYTGYLRIDEFTQTDKIPKNNSLNNETLLSTLNNETPTKTVWVNIDGKSSFDIIPQNYGLTDANRVYRLTYYAAVSPTVTNIKNIVVANEFTVTGTIGNGKGTLVLGGFHTIVSSTLTGSASYDFNKESLFYEKVYNTTGNANGEIYWLIRANGTLTKGMHIQDIPTDSIIRPDSMIGVYIGDKNYDFSAFTSFDELNKALSKMEKRECGTSSYSYDLQTISSLDDLDGDFAVFSKGENNNNGHSGYLMTGDIRTTKNNEDVQGITGRVLNTRINFGTAVNTTEEVQTWHFERVGKTDKFYIYYTDSLKNKHYMHIMYRSVTISTTKGDPLTVIIDNNNHENKIKIANPDDKSNKNNNLGEALNWYGNNGQEEYYSGWNNGDGDNNWHYLGKLNPNNSHIYDYSWSVNDSKGNLIINKDTVIPQDKSMYIVLRTYPSQELPEIDSKTFNNSIDMVDDVTGDKMPLGEASYIYTPNLPLRKEGMVAAYWNGQNWTIQSISPKDTRDTITELNAYFDQSGIVSRNGKGLYADWLMNVNWDGSLEGDVILTDYLDHKMEPLIVRQFWISDNINNDNDKPSYKNIPELDDDPMWKKITSQSKINGRPDVPFYYNETTGEIKIAVGNLKKSVGTNNSVVNLQLICRVTDPDVIFSGDVSTLTNKAELATTDGTIIGKQEIDHLINSTYSIEKTVTPPKDANNQYVGNSNKMTYTIEINPYAENLIDGDTLPVLIDKMTGKMELIGDIEVYKKVGDDETMLDNIDISIAKNGDVTPNTTTIEFKNLPDEMHLIIKYKTKVDVKPNQTGTDISNIAYWEGYGKPSTAQQSGEFKYTLSGYVSSKSYADVVIKKCDFYDSSITLNGAEFEIRQVDINGNVDTNDSNAIKATTDQNGKIHFNAESTSKLSFNTVYQIKETKAPTDYVLNETKKYFMVISGNGTHGYTITDDGKMSIGGTSVNVIIDYASDDNTIPDLELTIYNEKARVRIEKVFLDESNSEIESQNVTFFGTYRFGLYYSNPTTNPKAKCEQILSITYSGTGEPLYALDGKATNEPEFTKAKVGTENRAAVNYIYELNEKNEPITGNTDAYLNGYSFTVMYGNGNSVVVTKNGALNSITIKNKYNPIYMPSAGGIGLKNYYKISFFALMILSTLTAAVFRIRRKHK